MEPTETPPEAAAEEVPPSPDKPKPVKRGNSKGKGKRGARGESNPPIPKIKLKRKKHAQEEDIDPDSDLEFEQMLAEADESYRSESGQKPIRKKRAKKVDSEENGATEALLDELLDEPRPSKRVKKKSISSEPVPPKKSDFVNQEFCEVCRLGGEIILCDTCPRSFHLVCLNPELEDIPEGIWSCPKCVEEGTRGKPKEGKTSEKVEPVVKDHHQEFCRECKLGGNLILCETCPLSYHMHCVIPALKDIPDSLWSCPRCTCEPLPEKIQKVLNWRWVDIPDDEDENGSLESPNNEDADAEKPKPRKEEKQKTATRIREFFIKWEGKSYWECSWITELQFEVHQVHLWRSYTRRTNMDYPPPLEEFPDDRGGDNVKELELEERFFRYGIKPEWLEVHRILNHQILKNNKVQWLVKWRELGYDQATWEEDEHEATTFASSVEYYVELRSAYDKSQGRKTLRKILKRKRTQASFHVPPEVPESDPKKKYEGQPSFIEDQGNCLHEYQLEGLNWLRYSWSNKTDTILADEMGLGKTIQSISFLYSLWREGHCPGPFLVSAPLSTIINWEREFEQWAPEFYVVTYVGDRDSRCVMRENEFSFEEKAVRAGPKASKLRSGMPVKFHVLLTSYEMINIDVALLSSIHWKVLVIDEAHRLKSNQSKFFRTMQGYHINYKLLLTGTPLQNTLEELFHLLNFMCASKFCDLNLFLNEFADIAKEEQISKLHDLLGTHMLRRLKADVLKSMPSKRELIVRVDLSPLQKKLYKAVLTRNFEALNTRGTGQVSLLNIVMDLKKVCNHPYLFPMSASEARRNPNGSFEGSDLIKTCGKLILMEKMLKKLKAEGHRVLIFSQMTRVLDLLEDFCDHEGYKFERIDGSITGSVRQEAIDRFNAPGAQQFCFLLSTRAGGLGINLATADTVVIYDSDWNPHNDIQAFSRAHRLGQKEKVMIYRFVTRSSVEERVTQVAKRKMMLTHLVVRPGMGNRQASFSKKDLDDILRFGTSELFKENENENSENQIHYDDAAVDKLLERNQPEEEETGDTDGANEYLSQFKLATYGLKDGADSEEPEDDPDTEVIKTEEDTSDPNYWEKLLRHHYEHEQESKSQRMGRGKRERKQVRYTEDAMREAAAAQYEEYNPDEEFSSGDEDSNDEVHVGSRHRRKANDSRPEKIPPMLARVKGSIEVFGFNARQRKAFYNSVMRFGIPPPDAYDKQWLSKDLRTKLPGAYGQYTKMFLRHLCEPGHGTDCYADGVPREGISRGMVLTRIGIMSLIRKKVNEYGPINGEYSLPHLVKQLIESKEKERLEKKRLKEEAQEAMKLAVLKAQENANVGDAGASNQPVTAESVKAEKAAETVKSEEDKASTEPPAKKESEEKEEEKVPAQKFMFNIADAAFTELHTLWANEERALVQQKEKSPNAPEIWNRKHDYWLLAGVARHGYARWADILNDVRYHILNQPFQNSGDESNRPSFSDIKNKFIARRFKLLEQSLVIEEQIRRSAMLHNSLSNCEALSLDERHSKLEYVTLACQKLVEGAASQSNAAKMVLSSILSTLDQLLNEMKNDLGQLPSHINHLSNAPERLQFTERHILSRLVGSSLLNGTDSAENKESSPNDDESVNGNVEEAETADEAKIVENPKTGEAKLDKSATEAESLDKLNAKPDVAVPEFDPIAASFAFKRKFPSEMLNIITKREKLNANEEQDKTEGIKQENPETPAEDTSDDENRLVIAEGS